MQYLLSVLIFLGATSIAHAEEQYLLFTATKELPNTVVGWKEYLETKYEPENIEYQSEFRNLPYGIGFLVKVDSPKIGVEHWLGIGKDYKKEFPIRLKLSDTRILEQMGLLSMKTRYPSPEKIPTCDGQLCKTTFKGPCYDFGCDTAFVITREGSVESIQWDFAYD